MPCGSMNTIPKTLEIFNTQLLSNALKHRIIFEKHGAFGFCPSSLEKATHNNNTALKCKFHKVQISIDKVNLEAHFKIQ